VTHAGARSERAGDALPAGVNPAVAGAAPGANPALGVRSNGSIDERFPAVPIVAAAAIVLSALPAATSLASDDSTLREQAQNVIDQYYTAQAAGDYDSAVALFSAEANDTVTLRTVNAGLRAIGSMYGPPHDASQVALRRSPRRHQIR
jgi:hypothetical protein